MDKKIDLNAPAFGPEAQRVSELVSEDTKEEVQETKPEVETEETPQEQSKVPYSRFKKFHDLAKEAEAEAAKWRAEYEELKNKPEPISYNEELPREWVELYGDSEKSKAAWKVQQDMFRKAEERAEQRAMEAVQNQRFEEQQRIEDNLETIDSTIDEFTDTLGRGLTEKEESDLLDAVDFLTPKDRYGNYAGPLVSFDAAWDYVQAKQGTVKARTAESRNKVANLSSSHSQGEPSLTEKEERDKNFNPFAWNAYKDRLK